MGRHASSGKRKKDKGPSAVSKLAAQVRQLQKERQQLGMTLLNMRQMHEAADQALRVASARLDYTNKLLAYFVVAANPGEDFVSYRVDAVNNVIEDVVGVNVEPNEDGTILRFEIVRKETHDEDEDAEPGLHEDDSVAQDPTP